MNGFQITAFVILTGFVLSVPLATIDANTDPDNPWTNTYKTPSLYENIHISHTPL
jgi:hypothetical protein